MFLFQIGSIRSWVTEQVIDAVDTCFYSRLVRLEAQTLSTSGANLQVSIPDWFDQKLSPSPCLRRRLRVSIPDWFDQKTIFSIVPVWHAIGFYSRLVRLEDIP